MFAAFQKIYRYRDVLKATTRTELQTRYSGSVMGVAWAVIGPMILMGFYTVIYTVIFQIRPATLTVAAYILYVVSALVPFISFAQSLGAGAACLRANKQLMLSTVFPTELVPVRTMLVVNVVLLTGVPMIMVISLFFKTPSLWLLALPLVFLFQILFTIGVAWIFSLVNLVMQDLMFLIQYVVMMLLIITPIGYTPDMVPSALSAVIYFNPLYYFTSAYQSIIVYNTHPPLFNMIVGSAMSLIVFALGYRFFMRAKAVIFDYA